MMETVDVLLGIDGAQHLRLVHVLRQRKLHEDAVDRVVGVQLGDEVEDLALGRIRRETVVARLDPGLVRRLVLRADVDVRRGIVADENRREAHGLAIRPHVLGNLCANLLCERLSVDSNRRHRARTLVTHTQAEVGVGRPCGRATVVSIAA